MDKAKQWIALTAVGVLAVMAGGWFLLVSPKRTEASDVRALVSSQESTNATLKTQLARLKQQAKTLPQQQAKLAAVAAKVPDNPALPSLVRALNKAADRAGVSLVSIAPGTPVDVAAPVATRPTAAKAATGAASKAAGSSTTATKTTLAAASATSTAGTLQSIPLSIKVAGSFFQIEQFMDEVERISRAFKTTGLMMEAERDPSKNSSGPGVAAAVESGRSLVAEIGANVYMAKGRGVAAAPVAPVK